MRVYEGMQGLGDNVYQRAVLEQVCAEHGRIALLSPWPQVYAGLPIDVYAPRTTRLRTQRRNVVGLAMKSLPPTLRVTHRIGYGSAGTILEDLERSVGIRGARLRMSLPSFPAPDLPRPYIVVRPATLRAEWRADARNPAPGLIAHAVSLMRKDFYVVSVADVNGVAEWFSEPPPPSDHQYHAGELRVERLLGLMQHASGIIGGVGFALPVALAYRIPMLLIYGGWGFFNGPQRVLDKRIDSSHIVQASPRPLCMCTTRTHNCDKRIPDLETHVEHFRDVVARRVALAA
jgi:hypothetical protein